MYNSNRKLCVKLNNLMQGHWIWTSNSVMTRINFAYINDDVLRRSRKINVNDGYNSSLQIHLSTSTGKKKPRFTIHFYFSFKMRNKWLTNPTTQTVCIIICRMESVCETAPSVHTKTRVFSMLVSLN